jgi:hypothetical protein
MKTQNENKSGNGAEQIETNTRKFRLREVKIQISESVDFDGGLGNSFVGEELRYLEPLITLKLYNLTELFVVY